MLVATILSAQCTDAQVNKVTPALFERYKTAADFASSDLAEMEGHIRSTGFYRQKARAIVRMTRTLEEKFGGVVPRTMEELLQLHGVGRKTANVIIGGAFGRPGMVVDTHVRRISQRWGLTINDDPAKIERDLMALLPREAWSDFSLRVIYFGREICSAKSPQCLICPLKRLCPSARFGGSPPWMKRRRAGPAASRGSAARRPAANRGAAGRRAPAARGAGTRGTSSARGRPRTGAAGTRRPSHPGPSTPG
ncbi:MAG: endonuclease III [Armatimonadetes bacterium RBG_16_67_12]|nr:MAG: endonuclease III [Armatimonadetes bacterium RBG_16_67_12]